MNSSKNILVINLKYIGDTIWMYPFIKNLKLNLPGANITALINQGGESLLRLMPELHEVMVVDRNNIKGTGGLVSSLKLYRRVRAKHFDTVFILSNSDRATFIGFLSGAVHRIGFLTDNWLRSRLLTRKSIWDGTVRPHMVEYNLQLLTDSGLKIFDPSLLIPVPKELTGQLKKRFSIQGHTQPAYRKKKKTVIIHPGSRGALRQWGVKNFIRVINALSDKYSIFLAAAPFEQDIVSKILAGLHRKPDLVTTGLNLLEFAALCRLCDLFIGNDSAPIHMAAAADIYVIGVYGPTMAKYCAPWTEKKVLFDEVTIPCKLCDQKQCYNDIFQACFSTIQPEQIVEAAKEILDEP